MTWDYRGQFGSVNEHVEFKEIPLEAHTHDLDAILDHEGWDQVYMLGWSMVCILT